MAITLRKEIPAPILIPVDEPFGYGWRYLKQARPDGMVQYEPMALPLDDALDPQAESFIVVPRNMTELSTTCRAPFGRCLRTILPPCS